MMGLETARRHVSADEAGDSLVRASFACLDQLERVKLSANKSPTCITKPPVCASRQAERTEAEAAVHLQALDALTLRDASSNRPSIKRTISRSSLDHWSGPCSR